MKGHRSCDHAVEASAAVVATVVVVVPFIAYLLHIAAIVVALADLKYPSSQPAEGARSGKLLLLFCSSVQVTGSWLLSF